VPPVGSAESNLNDRDGDELYDIGEEAGTVVADADVPGTQVELGGEGATGTSPSMNTGRCRYAAAIIGPHPGQRNASGDRSV
jgi:hypothetical protein